MIIWELSDLLSLRIYIAQLKIQFVALQTTWGETFQDISTNIITAFEDHRFHLCLKNLTDYLRWNVSGYINIITAFAVHAFFILFEKPCGADCAGQVHQFHAWNTACTHKRHVNYSTIWLSFKSVASWVTPTDLVFPKKNKSEISGS